MGKDARVIRDTSIIDTPTNPVIQKIWPSPILRYCNAERIYYAFIITCHMAFFLLAAHAASASTEQFLNEGGTPTVPTWSIELSQAQNEPHRITQSRKIEGEVVRAVRSVQFLFDIEGRPLLVVNWWVSATRSGLHINGNTDIEIRVNNELAEILHFTGIASYFGVCAGGICTGCPIGLVCSGRYCLCDSQLTTISAPMNVRPGDRVHIRLLPARGGVRDFEYSDNEFEVVYVPQSKTAPEE